MLILENLVTGYISANFTENETAWLVGTAYSYGGEAREGHYIYKSLVSGTNTNKGNQPSISPLHWKKNRPSNYFAALDNVNLTQTQNADKVEFTILGSNYDAISILGIDGYSVSIVMTDLVTNTVVFNDTQTLDNKTGIIDEISYWFNDFDFATTYFSRLPIYSNSTIKVTINKLGSTAKVGTLSSGKTLYLGNTTWGVSFDMESWGRKVVDEFGATELTHTNSVYGDTYTLNIPSTKIRELQRKVKQYDFKPLVFIGDETDNSLFENLVDIGYWEAVKMVLSGPVNSTVNITKKGLI